MEVETPAGESKIQLQNLQRNTNISNFFFLLRYIV